jgi:hypothetical protein
VTSGTTGHQRLPTDQCDEQQSQLPTTPLSLSAGAPALPPRAVHERPGRPSSARRPTSSECLLKIDEGVIDGPNSINNTRKAALHLRNLGALAEGDARYPVGAAVASRIGVSTPMSCHACLPKRARGWAPVAGGAGASRGGRDTRRPDRTARLIPSPLSSPPQVAPWDSGGWHPCGP